MMAIVPTEPAFQVAAIKAMAAKVSGLLEGRIGDASVVLKTTEKMPERSDGGPAYGYWKASLREIWLWDETDEYPVDKTLAHEAMHVLDSDWLTMPQRVEIIELMSPSPTGWKDQLIGTEIVKYKALPLEVFAVYASAAVVGLSKPAYTRLFKRSVPEQKWPKLAQITLRDTDHEARGSTQVDNVVVPPDPLDAVAAELAAAQTHLTEAIGARDVAEMRRDLAEGKLAHAKAIAAEIGTDLAAGDLLSSQDKVAELEAL